MLRKAITTVTEWLHGTLLLAILLPLFYAVGMTQMPQVERRLYVISLLIALPIVLSGFVVRKCKGMFLYLTSAILIFVATGALAIGLGYLTFRNELMWGYVGVMLLETFYVLLSRLLARLNRESAENEVDTYNPYWQPTYELIEKPGAVVLVYFFVIYLLGRGFANTNVCNEALFSAIIYVFVLVLHRFVEKTEEYLSLNKRVCNLPSRRVYGIGAGMLALFLALLLFAAVPAVLTTQQRQYSDFREWLAGLEMDETEFEQESEVSEGGADPMVAFLESMGEPKETPIWLQFLLRVIGVLMFMGVFVGIFRAVRETFHTFRETYDENGDVVEELSRTERTARKVRKRHNIEKNSPRELIRREYRRTIRRYRKEIPQPYETPFEIETAAGIAKEESIQELHGRYERMRYGK